MLRVVDSYQCSKVHVQSKSNIFVDNFFLGFEKNSFVQWPSIVYITR
jgi:hypothetical protein